MIDLVKRNLKTGIMPPAKDLRITAYPLAKAIGELHDDYERIIDSRTEQGTPLSPIEFSEIIDRTSTLMKWLIGVLAEEEA